MFRIELFSGKFSYTIKYKLVKLKSCDIEEFNSTLSSISWENSTNSPLTTL